MDKREKKKEKIKKCRIFKRCTFNSRKTTAGRFRTIIVISIHNHGRKGGGGGGGRGSVGQEVYV